jgi:hypothetical protein
MVRDRQIFVAEGDALHDHGLDGVATIAPVRVHMQIAADIRAGDQRRQPAHERGFYRFAVVAKLGWDKRETERRVDIFLARRQHSRAVGRPEPLVVKHEPLIERHPAKPIQVTLAAGELQQLRAGNLRNPAVNRNLSAVDREIDLSGSVLPDVRTIGQCSEYVGHCSRVVS